MYLKRFFFILILILSQSIALGSEYMIKIYYDNQTSSPKFLPGWGFSALVKYNGTNILFDTGGDEKILRWNMKRFDSDAKYIKYVFISHHHWDHVNGLGGILRKDQNVYILQSFPKSIKEKIEKYGANRIEVTEFTEILPGVYSTGPLGQEIEEQALILDTSDGLIVLVGCSHPGIDKMLKFAKDKLKKDVYLVVGGFHLYQKSMAFVKNLAKELKDLGIRKVGPCHCTGSQAISIFKQEFGNDFIEVKAGSIVE